VPAPLDHPLLSDYPGPDRRVLCCVVAYNRHGGYCVPRGAMHRPCAQAILRGEEFEPETVKVIQHHAAAGDVIHAGTFFGDMLPAAARATAARGLVWAFEPNRESHRCAAITVALNGLVNVRLEHAALGAAASEALLRVRGGPGRPEHPAACRSDADVTPYPAIESEPNGHTRINRDGPGCALSMNRNDTSAILADDPRPAFDRLRGRLGSGSKPDGFRGHRWWFTPAVFELFILDLRAVGVVSMEAETFPADGVGFSAILRTCAPWNLTSAEYVSRRSALCRRIKDETAVVTSAYAAVACELAAARAEIARLLSRSEVLQKQK